MRPLRHVACRPAQPDAARAVRGARGAALAVALLVALATGEAVGQPGGLFREAASAAAVASPDLPAVSDSVTLRLRLVAIDFGQLTRRNTAATVPGGAQAASGVLTLNLFDDASFTGLVQSVAPTFSGGYSLSGPLAGVEMGAMTLVVNGDVAAGTVRTPEATYRIRPAGAGLHAVSEVDPSRLPPHGEPIPGRGREDEERPPLGPDGGLPTPVESRLAPPVRAAFRATEDTPSADAQGSIATDRAALEALYDATDGPNWTDSTNWKTDAPLGEWFGVTTDSAGRVIWVGLGWNRLSGTIPDELGNLTNLEGLELRYNFDLSVGPMPAWLRNLVNLRWLFLEWSGVTGQIPAWLGSMTSLERLYLSGNELTGGIPDELGNLTNLEGLALNSNDLGVGPIPASLGNLANLRFLSLGDTGVTGGTPAWLGSLTNLEVLELWSNDLTGDIPDELGNLSNLRSLYLTNNWSLTGPLPQGLRSSPLEQLELFATQACVPVAWRDWLGTIDSFLGRLCAGADVTVDVAVVYTPAAREAAGGTDAIEAEIDLMVAETNEAYAASGVQHRLALVERFEVSYAETGNSSLDLRRLREPSDGHMDRVHELRDRVGADLVHLVVGDSDVGGRADLVGAFSLGQRCCFAHELGTTWGFCTIVTPATGEAKDSRIRHTGT